MRHRSTTVPAGRRAPSYLLPSPPRLHARLGAPTSGSRPLLCTPHACARWVSGAGCRQPASAVLPYGRRAAAKAARRRWVPGWDRASSTEHREVSRDPHREEERGRVLDRSRRLCAVRPTADCPSRRPSGMGWKGRSREGGRISGFLLQWATSGLNYFGAPTVIRRRN